ncbi:hypothetical protein ACFL0V_07010 [Nanoarchaeota archaeon]
MIKKLFGPLAALLIASSPAYADPPTPKPPIVQKENSNSLEKKVNRTISATKNKRPKKNNPDPTPYFTGSSIGTSVGLNFSVPGRFTINPDSIWYKNFSYNFSNDPIATLRFHANNPNLPSTPLDNLTTDLFQFEGLGDRLYGDFSIRDYYNLFRLFLDEANTSFNNNIFSVNGTIRANASAHAELFSTYYFRKGDDLIRYDHSIAGHALASGSLSVDGQATIGEGLNLNIHPLEKYFGSSLRLDFTYRYLVDLSAAETHQLSYFIRNGWQGIGLSYEEFLRARGVDFFHLDAAATLDQISEARLAELNAHSEGDRSFTYGKSYLFYLFRTQSFKQFWYYAMLGANHTDSFLSTMRKDESDSTVVNMDTSITSTSDYDRVESSRNSKRLQLNYAILAGLNFADLIHPYFGATNYPNDHSLSGVSLTLPHFIADLSVFTADYQPIQPRFEFYIPLTDRGNPSPLLEYFQQRAINKISPFAAKHSIDENLRLKAYAQLRSPYIIGSIDDQDARLSFFANNGKYFAEFGVSADLKGDGAGLFSRIGMQNWGLLIQYSPTTQARTGESASLALTGDFNSYYLKFFAKALWNRPSGILHTTFDTIQKNEQYFVITFGRVW